MDEELLFEYPVQEDRAELKTSILDEKRDTKKSTMIVCISSLFGLILIASSMFFSSSTVRLLMMIVGVFLMLIGIKHIYVLNDRTHDLTMISAYETYMDIEVITVTGKTHKLHINYSDIRLCYLSKQYDMVRFLYNHNKRSYQELTDIDGKELEVFEGEFRCPICPGYLQLFFLYLARQYFDIQPGGKEIVKKFGLKEEYIRKYIGE